MEKNIILLTKSRKNYGYCVTGIDMHSGKWIRLIASKDNNYPIEAFKYADSNMQPELLDIMAVKIGDNCSTDVHPEDCHSLGIMHKMEALPGSMNAFNERLAEDQEFHDFVFYNNYYKLDSERYKDAIIAGKHSLHLINPIDLRLYKTAYNKIVASFTYRNVQYDNIRVTDYEFTESCEELNRAGEISLYENYYIVVSLGDVYRNNRNDRDEYYKLVASIISKERVGIKLKELLLDYETEFFLGDLCRQYIYYLGFPLAVRRTNWTKDYYFVIQYLEGSSAVGYTVKDDKIHNPKVSYKLDVGKFVLHKSMQKRNRDSTADLIDINSLD